MSPLLQVLFAPSESESLEDTTGTRNYLILSVPPLRGLGVQGLGLRGAFVLTLIFGFRISQNLGSRQHQDDSSSDFGVLMNLRYSSDC